LCFDLISCAKFSALDSPTPAQSTVASRASDATIMPDMVIETDETVVSASNDTIPPATLPENELALADCIKQWPNVPEAAELAKKAVVIDLNKFASNELVFEDSKQTNEPVMYLLNLNFDIKERGQMQLRNKKGWYCLAVRTRTVNIFEIGVACETVIATATAERQIFDQFNITRDSICN
jgi:hypothetical protein